MKIKDIVNRDIVNLTNCEHEPIHIPGSIQPNGFLLGLINEDFTVDYCSANTLEYIDTEAKDLLGKSFESVFGADQFASFKKYLGGDLKFSSPYALTHHGKAFLCSVNISNNITVFEAEPVLENEKDLPGIYEQSRQFLSYLAESISLQDLCRSVADTTRELTGYDRVMIYRFDKDYNGEVFAESVKQDLEPFLGLHYPHTDIPVQARQLYLTNLLRIITDINYTPVPLYTIDDTPGKNLDLGNSILRSTSPIHVQYLQNMGVGATLTISLIHKGKLWGLIACHHYSAKNISPQQRIAALLQGHFITSQIDVRQENEEYGVATKLNNALEHILSITFNPTHESFADIVARPELLDICNAGGVSILIGDKVYKGGITPREDTIQALSRKLADQTSHTVYNSSNLPAEFADPGINAEEVSGILYYSLSLSNTDCIIWYRPEVITEVNWAGDPEKAIVKNEKGLHPRNSFALWQQKVRGQSKAWLKVEINTATNYTHTLQKHVTLIYIAEEEAKLRKLAISLKESNDELENINWISTHDLQEPLRKIQILTSKVLAYDEDTPVAYVNPYLNKMNASAGRMRTFLHDIMNHSKLKGAKIHAVKVKLDDIAQSVLAELGEGFEDKDISVSIGPLPEINGDAFLIRQLFVNLLNNAVKFSDKGRKLDIKITCSEKPVLKEDEEGLKRLFTEISVSDTGIGFDNKFAESIFTIFKRLHSQSVFEGSGVGLALCKKIMTIHRGLISAEGELGKGATFHLYFPVGQQ